MDTDSLSNIPFMFSWQQPGRQETEGFCVCVCVCVCQKNQNNANELMFPYQMYLAVA